jgi:hypothetical protein
LPGSGCPSPCRGQGSHRRDSHHHTPMAKCRGLFARAAVAHTDTTARDLKSGHAWRPAAPQSHSPGSEPSEAQFELVVRRPHPPAAESFAGYANFTASLQTRCRTHAAALLAFVMTEALGSRPAPGTPSAKRSVGTRRAASMQDTLSEGTARTAQLAPSAVTAGAVGGPATRGVVGRVSSGDERRSRGVCVITRRWTSRVARGRGRAGSRREARRSWVLVVVDDDVRPVLRNRRRRHTTCASQCTTGTGWVGRNARETRPCARNA